MMITMMMMMIVVPFKLCNVFETDEKYEITPIFLGVPCKLVVVPATNQLITIFCFIKTFENGRDNMRHQFHKFCFVLVVKLTFFSYDKLFNHQLFQPWQWPSSPSSSWISYQYCSIHKLVVITCFRRFWNWKSLSILINTNIQILNPVLWGMILLLFAAKNNFIKYSYSVFWEITAILR